VTDSPWFARSLFDWLMDEIVAAESAEDVEDLRRMARRLLLHHPRLRDLERVADAKRQLLNREAAG
jgi:hypothetical protein